MKHCYQGLMILFALLFASRAEAQVTGAVTVPSATYPDLASVISALNTQGVGAGGATVTLTAGNPQTAPAGGYQLGTTLLNASTGAANPLKFVGNGNTITAPAGTSATVDGIFFIKGTDYLTIDGLNLQEAASNTTPAACMEFGYAMVNLNGAAPFDGCQNDTIRNCTITLTRAVQTPTRGIYSNHHVAANNTLFAITAAEGLHSNNRFLGNTISNVVTGISLSGNSAATTPALFDQNNQVGGSAAGQGNTITNFGGAIYISIGGITGTYQQNFVVRNNNLNNLAAGGVPAVGGIWGVYFFGAGGTATVSNNTINVSIGSVNTGLNYFMYGVYANALGSNMTISNNTITTNVVAGTGTTFAVPNYNVFHANFATSAITGNTLVQNVNTAASGSSANYVIHAQPTNAGGVVIDGNSIQQISTVNTASQFFSIAVQSATGNTPASEVITNNTFNNTNLTPATGGNHMLIFTNSITGSKTITGNSISGTYQSGTGTFLAGVLNAAVSAPPAGNVNIAGNNFSNITFAGAPTVYGFYSSPTGTSPQTYTVSGNTFSSVTATGAASINGVYLTGGTGADVFQNTIGSINSGGGTVTGLFIGSTGANNIYRNKIHSLSSTTAAGVVHGINLAAGTTSRIYNNTIGAFTTSAATSTTDVIRGINLSTTVASSTVGVYYNSIYLNASSTGANFSTSGIFQTASTTSTTATADLQNNIVINNSTPSGTGITAALRRSGTGSNTAATTNRNIYYAGTPGTSRLIFYDGTNSFQTLATYQAAAPPMDANSFTENSPFASTTGTAANFLHFNPSSNTYAESSGANVAGITNDFDADIRQNNTGYTGNGTAPDIGADEFNNCGTIAISSQPINDTACTASTADFTVTGSNTSVYQWQVNTGSGFSNVSNGGVYSGATTAHLVVTNPPATMDGYEYRVILRSGPTCTGFNSNTVRLAVTSSPPATVTASGSLTICEGDTVTLSAPAAGNLNYQWKRGTGNIAGATASSLAVTTSGSYTVVVSSTNGCSATSTASVVTVNPRPVAQVTYSSPISFCQGAAVVLNASAAPGTTYQWYRNDTLLTGATTAYHTATDSGSYKVVVTNANNCDRASAPVQVIVHRKPMPVITANGLTLSVSAIYAAYQWRLDNTDIAGATAPTHTMTSNGSYSVWVLDANGCENVSPVYYLGNLKLNSVAGAEKGILSYPSPASGYVTIENQSNVAMTGIAIYNSLGAQVFTSEPATNKQTIRLETFPAGLYTIRVQTAAGTVSRKLEIVR